jgi:hypothetical protein
VDRIVRISRTINGLSKGVFIHFQFQDMAFSNKKAVRAIRVTIWMMVMAHSWTDALASGVKMSRANIA